MQLSVGESYVDLSQDDAQEHIGRLVEECEESVSKYESEISEVCAPMELVLREALVNGDWKLGR